MLPACQGQQRARTTVCFLLGRLHGHHGQKLNAFSLSGVNRWAPDSKWKWGKEMGIAKPEVPNPPNSPTRG